MTVTERQYQAMQRSHATWQRVAQYHSQRGERQLARKAQQEAEALRQALAAAVIAGPLAHAH